jgi:flagellar motor switch protein FliG
MSLMARLRKNGGLGQILAMLESSTPDRQKHLLRSLQHEDPSLAALLRTKVLNVERVARWPQSVLRQIVLTLDDATCRGIASALQEAVDPQLQQRWFEALDPFRRPKIEANAHAPELIEAARFQLFARIRDLERNGEIHLAEFDPGAQLDELVRSNSSSRVA